MARTRNGTKTLRSKPAKNYKHPEAESPMRPEKENCADVH